MLHTQNGLEICKSTGAVFHACSPRLSVPAPSTRVFSVQTVPIQTVPPEPPVSGQVSRPTDRLRHDRRRPPLTTGARCRRRCGIPLTRPTFVRVRPASVGQILGAKQVIKFRALVAGRSDATSALDPGLGSVLGCFTSAVELFQQTSIMWAQTAILKQTNTRG